jgi:glycerol kinase
LLEGIAWQDAQRRVSVLEGTVNGAGAALQWLADERGIEIESLLRDAPRWLEEVVDPPLFLNGVGGLGSPYWIPDAPISFDNSAGLAAETVAVLESIVFLLQVNIEVIRTVAPARVPTPGIVISGGLARLDGICQRLADLSGQVVERPAEFEATAHGLAWLLDGIVPRQMSPARFTPSPAAGRDIGLEARFRKWHTLVGHLAPTSTGRKPDR